VEERPAPGALDLYVPLASELSIRSGQQGIELAGALGAVRYGEAFALLATAHACGSSRGSRDGGVRIHVDAELMERAQFPLVIDPVVSTFGVDNFPILQLDPDIAYDASLDRYLIAYEVPFSATDGDVYAQLRGQDGTIYWSGFVEATTTDWRSPQVAGVDFYDKFLIVVQAHGHPGTTGWAVVGYRFDATTGPLGFKFLISTNDMLGDQARARRRWRLVPGTSAAYCVVWQRNYLVRRTSTRAW
jgi:hypothetical protein